MTRRSSTALQVAQRRQVLRVQPSPASHSARPVILARIHETKVHWASGILVARLKGWKSQKT
jgi:hypothetical protein